MLLVVSPASCGLPRRMRKQAWPSQMLKSMILGCHLTSPGPQYRAAWLLVRLQPHVCGVRIPGAPVAKERKKSGGLNGAPEEEGRLGLALASGRRLDFAPTLYGTMRSQSAHQSLVVEHSCWRDEPGSERSFGSCQRRGTISRGRTLRGWCLERMHWSGSQPRRRARAACRSISINLMTT
jgi:hypothetical protein